ncbi:MAG: chemotaxis protein CheA [Pseudorhodoplanes sp.]|jgi:two-component system chemotaxis sensor kinase CheA|nr:chemotaxis protein CheA [Pseudorhodoplanes sp.]
MSSLTELKNTFFEECSELLQELELGLTDMREERGTEDTVHALFRAVHSIKGGAGVFGFDNLIGFAHVLETVLDAVRRGDLDAGADVVDVLFNANDILSDLVTMARSGQTPEAGFGDDCRLALEKLIGKDGSEGDASGEMADFEGIDFVPVRFDAEDDTPAGNTFAITFRPKQDLLKKANEPLFILRELRSRGELDLVAEIGNLPPLTELEPDFPYIGWTGTLRTQASRAEIEEIFEFVAGDCELEIVDQTPPADALPVFDEPAPQLVPEPVADMPAPAASMPTLASETVMTPPPPPAPAAEKSEGGAKAPVAQAAATTIRVDLDKVDRVVNMVGELVIAQAMLGQVVQDLPEAMSARMMQILEEVTHHTRELKDSVMSMRAQPVKSVFQRMPRLVRELSAKTGKKIALEMYGETTEVDKTIIERLSDPLTHIIRNSCDHGIETPDVRAAAGKPEEGTIILSAEHRGGRIVIEIKDDGAGINSERVLKKARERGLVSADAALTEDEINNLIFMPGFSTAETVSDISGRGVGMDVVRRNIQDLGGRINLKSERGKGMTIQLTLPLTLAVMDGMVVRVGAETYVLPMAAIVECLRPGQSEVHNLLGTHGTLHLRGEIVPMVHLGDALGVPSTLNSGEGVVIIIEAGEGIKLGLAVDDLLGHQQVVIKSIEENYGTVPGIAAATILGNGRVAFILDSEKIYDLACETMNNTLAGAAGSRLTQKTAA